MEMLVFTGVLSAGYLRTHMEPGGDLGMYYSTTAYRGFTGSCEFGSAGCLSRLISEGVFITILDFRWFFTTPVKRNRHLHNEYVSGPGEELQRQLPAGCGTPDLACES